MDWNHLLPYLAPVLVVFFLARRLIRNAPRKVKVGRLFILPTIIALGVVGTFAASPVPAPIWIAGFAVALALGAGVGFLTTHHQEFAIDQDGDVTARATPIGSLLVLAFFAARFGLKYFMAGGNPYAPAIHANANVLGWADAGLMFSTGLVFARALTTWVHARPLIESHKAQKAMAAEAPPSHDASQGNP